MSEQQLKRVYPAFLGIGAMKLFNRQEDLTNNPSFCNGDSLDVKTRGTSERYEKITIPLLEKEIKEKNPGLQFKPFSAGELLEYYNNTSKSHTELLKHFLKSRLCSNIDKKDSTIDEKEITKSAENIWKMENLMLRKQHFKTHRSEFANGVFDAFIPKIAADPVFSAKCIDDLKSYKMQPAKVILVLDSEEIDDNYPLLRNVPLKTKDGKIIEGPALFDGNNTNHVARIQELVKQKYPDIDIGNLEDLIGTFNKDRDLRQRYIDGFLKPEISTRNKGIHESAIQLQKSLTCPIVEVSMRDYQHFLKEKNIGALAHMGTPVTDTIRSKTVLSMK